ncbi:MAG: gliding motility-associated C-terminal domain-containing protein, partial [Bacteroidota bacterium]
MDSGLEIGIYEATDCANPVSVGSCFGGFSSIPPGESRVFENQVPLVVGQYYYIVMDGARDDVCDWRFTVIEGTTEVAPLTVSGPIIGPVAVCPDVPFAYTTNAELGATAFSWSVNGQEVATGQSPVIVWDTEGTFELCVTAANACDQAAPFCTQVTVTAPETNVIDTVICSNQTFVFADSTLSETGQYFFDFTSAIGCDSNFVINLVSFESQEETVVLNVCSDDVLELNGETFTETGNFQQILSNQFGCDSTLNIDLTFIECNITATSVVTAASCLGATDGQVTFSVLTGTPPFTYRTTDLSGQVLSTGNISGLNVSTTVGNIAPGQYQIIIEDEFGNDTRILNLLVTEPSALTATAAFSDFNGFPISCFGQDDGTVQLTPTGGTAPYAVEWGTGIMNTRISNLPAGSYPYTVTDANGCRLEAEAQLLQPPPITATTVVDGTNCDGPDTGSIEVNSATGGVGSFRYALNGATPTDTTAFTRLRAGVYTVAISDANNCQAVVTDTVGEALIPVLDFPQDLEIFELGAENALAYVAFNALSLRWSNDLATSITDSSSNQITLRPLSSGTLVGTAISADGCVTQDSVQVIITNPKKVYAPTAFSPNADGINDDFALAAGQGVLQIEGLQVFNRWGGLVYEQRGVEEAWNGQDAAAGVYVWRAYVVYLDGQRELI